MSSQVRQIVPHKIAKTNLELQDYDTIMLDKVTLIPMNSLFRLEKQEVLPYERLDNTWVSVTIERDLNMMHYERKVFTIFDMLSDIGGLTGIIATMFGIICAAWNYNAFDNFMVSRLFKIKKRKQDIDPGTPIFNQSDYIDLSSAPNFTDWFYSCLPKRFTRCCKRDRKSVALQMAREKLFKEINIVEIVKSWRYFDLAIKSLLDERQRIDFKEKSRYIAIDPDPADEETQQKKTFAMMAKRTQSIRRHNMSDGFFSSEDDDEAFKEA